MNNDRKRESLINMMKFRRAVETENEDVEKFSSYSLKTTEEKYPSEDIMLYGVAKNSRYIALDSSLLERKSDAPAVYISQSMQSKYGYQVGDTITLKEEYEDTTYTFHISLSNLAGEDLTDMLDRVRALKKIDGNYDNFSGLEEDTEGGVRFVIEKDDK